MQIILKDLDFLSIDIKVKRSILLILMKTFIFLCCLTAFGFTPNNIWSQNEKIKIDTDKTVTIDEVFNIIDKQTNFSFVYRGSIFKNAPKVKLKKGTIRLGKLLNKILDTNDLKITIEKNNTIIIQKKEGQNSPIQKQISGKVTDKSGQPIPGVTILIKGTNKGTSTDFDGNYKITVPSNKNTLIFSSLGFEKQEINTDNLTSINVVLKESVNTLDEIVINAGYYKTTEREKTGSISKIEAKTIEKQPVNSPLAAMVGQMSGVNITQASGVPGGGFDIAIRGTNSINADQNSPLYIVDGVPYSSEPIGVNLSGAVLTKRANPISAINPSDIESIEVLKDADATAIYGSRGANGVVLITTKKGKAGKTQVKVTVSNTLGTTIFQELMNTEQYLNMRLEALANDGYTLDTAPLNFQLAAHDLYRWDQNRYTDWQKVLLGGTSYRHNAQLSFSGGSEQTQFLFSGGYQKETSVFPGDSNYGRASVHSVFSHQSTDERFQLNVSTTYTVEDNQLPQVSLASTAYRLAPNAPALYDENGDLNREENGGFFENPLLELERKYRAQSNTLIMNAVVSYRFHPELEFKTNLGYTSYSTEQYRTTPHTYFGPTTATNTSAKSIVNTSNTSRRSWIVEPQLHWQKKWGKGRFNALVGATFQHQQSKDLGLTGGNFPSNNQILNLSAAENVSVISDGASEYKYQAVFGRLNFKWDDRYIINLTGRRDGSSRFGPGRQFGNFGAVGGAWLFSKEAFLKDSDILSFGKLRSSYGITGSDGIPNYGFYDSYETSGSSYDGPVLEATGLFNPDFGWEENKKFEAALELGFFQDRIFVTAAWYRNRSSNQLVGIPLAETTGFNRINANFDATVENSGFEIDLHTTNIQNKQFNWKTRFNISVPKNKLVKFDGLEGSGYSNTYVIGAPLTIRKLYHNLGVDPDTGLYQFEDYNNDGIINIDDRQWIQDTAPSFFGGLGNTLSYKNWTFDVFLNFKKQNSTGDLLLSGFNPGFGLTNQHVSALDRWQQVGDEAFVQRYSIGSQGASNDNNSSRIYTNTSFIRLKTISLSYDLPKDIISGLHTRFYVQGQNLFYVYTTKYATDPEKPSSTGLPPLRQFTLGLEIGF